MLQGRSRASSPLTPALSPFRGEGARRSTLVSRTSLAAFGARLSERRQNPARPVQLRRASAATRSPLNGGRIPRNESPRVEPLNRSSRRKEALTSFPRRRVSLLTSAATRFRGSFDLQLWTRIGTMNRRDEVGQASSLSPRASCPRKELGLEAPATGWKPVLLSSGSWKGPG